jgi:hypothetical protein
MKRVLCPKCENYLYFDETKYSEGHHWYLNANIVASNSVSG